MFSHVVIFWTDPAIPNAADELIAGAYLKPIPGCLHFHVGKWSPATVPWWTNLTRSLNLVFRTQAQDDLSGASMHVQFEGVFLRVCKWW
jgi:hypothetical protein